MSYKTLLFSRGDTTRMPLERKLVRPKEEGGVEEIAEERALEEWDAGYVRSHEAAESRAIHTHHPRRGIGEEEELDAAEGGGQDDVHGRFVFFEP